MSTHVFPVYPSQLPKFKAKAKQLASYIEEKSGCAPLSSFKRNDWLSMGLSYKGHSDLVQSTKSRQSSDKNAHLVLFVKNDRVRKKIASVFSSQLTHIARSHIEEAINEMVKIERKELAKIRIKDRPPYQYRSDIFPIMDEATLLAIPKLLNEHYGTLIAGLWRLGMRYGLRITELLNVKFDDVNGSVITINTVKYGQSYQIRLGAQEVSIVNNIKKNNPNATFLFQSSKNKPHPTPISKIKVHLALVTVGKILGVKLSLNSMRNTYLFTLAKNMNDATAFQYLRKEDYYSVVRSEIIHQVLRK